MRFVGTPEARQTAKQLRREMTPPEIALWLALRTNSAGLRFRRQHAAGRYILDFFCAPARLAIEVDGQIHERGDHPSRDAERDEWLRDQGIEVVRFAASDVLTNTEGVARQIIGVATDRRGLFQR